MHLLKYRNQSHIVKYTGNSDFCNFVLENPFQYQDKIHGRLDNNNTIHKMVKTTATQIYQEITIYSIYPDDELLLTYLYLYKPQMHLTIF